MTDEKEEEEEEEKACTPSIIPRRGARWRSFSSSPSSFFYQHAFPLFLHWRQMEDDDYDGAAEI